MAKYLSNRQQNLKIGISSYTEDQTVLQVTGKVGIGTTNASSRLDVRGDVNVSGVVTATSFSGSGTNLTGIVTSIVAGTNITVSGSTGQVTINSTGSGGGSISISTNTTNQNQYIPYVTSFGSTTGLGATNNFVFNPSTGNLGIGTTNASSKLDVRGDVSISSTVGIGTIIDIIPYDTINSGTLSFEGSAGQLFSITNNLTTGSIFSVNDVSGIPSIDVDANGTVSMVAYGGNLGIGTTNPTSKLSVLGNVNVIGIVTATTFSGQVNAGVGTITNLTSTNIVGSALSVSGISTFTNGPVFIGSATSTGTATQRLQVTGNAYVSGNLGIGTTNPTSKLQVIGDVNVSGVVIATSFSGSGTNLTGIVTSIVAGTGITISGSTGQVTINASSGGSISISTNTTNQNQYIPYVTSFGSTTGLGATNNFVFNPSTGNLGIGTTNPQTKLEINGVLGFGTFTGTYGGTGTNIRIGDNTTGASITGGYNNIFMGIGAGNSTTSGGYNNFLGKEAGRYNTTGFQNNFFGRCAGCSNIGGYNNNFLGSEAGRYNTTGNYNNFLGSEAGKGRKGRITSISITSSTTLAGEADNGYSNVSGSGGDGSNATFDVYRDSNGDVYQIDIITEGQNYNVGNTLTIDGGDVGGSSGTDDITITVDTVEGSTGSNNNFLGRYAGFCNTTGYNNNFLGSEAGRYNTTGSYNNFIGSNAGRYNTTGRYNNFFGEDAGFNNTTGIHNNFFGRFAGASNSSGGYNNFFGFYAGRNNTTGNNNNFIGNRAGCENTTGTDNNFFGAYAGRCNTTGNSNNFLGVFAGLYNTTGNSNNFLGRRAGNYNTTGCYNNFFGRYVGYYNTTGNSNNFIGAFSGISTSASNKIIFGSGFNSSNFFDAPDTTKDTQFAVGVRTDVNPANYWLVGNENFNVGIGTTNPTSKLYIVGDTYVTGVVTATSYYGDGANLTGINASGGVAISTNTTNQDQYITYVTGTGSTTGLGVTTTGLTFNPSTGNMVVSGTVTANSDEKLKTNIQTIPNALEKVLRLRGVEYDRIDTLEHQIGVIAQEVEKIVPEVVYPKQPAPSYETKSVAYANLIGLLIEAIKEQNVRIEELERKLGGL